MRVVVLLGVIWSETEFWRFGWLVGGLGKGKGRRRKAAAQQRFGCCVAEREDVIAQKENRHRGCGGGDIYGGLPESIRQ